MVNSSFIRNGSTGEPLTSENAPATFLTVVKLLICALVALVSLIGNIIIISVVFKTKKMHTNTYFLIVNTSVSDLLYTVIAMPPLITGILRYQLSIGSHWGTFICKFMNWAAFALIASSVLTLAAISFDRFFSIVHPMKKMNTKRSLKFMIILIWVCSLLVMSPMLYAIKLGGGDGFFYCYEDWSPYFDTDDASKAYTIALFIVIYMVPFTTTIMFYSLISHYLWFRKIPGNSNKSNKRRVMASRRKIILMLITIVFCFIVCWLPLQIVTFSLFFGYADLPVGLFFASEFLIRANGAINPIIYTVFNETFRGGFKSLLCCVYSPFKADRQIARNTRTLSFTPSIRYSNNHMHEKHTSLHRETPV